MASSDPKLVGGWWSHWPDANVGIACGGGLAVLDVDPRSGGFDSLRALEGKHGQLPATREVATGAGGRHLYFIVPTATASVDGLAPGLELKAEGKQVVAPPSIHPDTGEAYRWLEPHGELLPAPEWLLGLTANGSRGSAAPIAERIPEGQRYPALRSLAGTMRRRGMGGAEILAALRETNRLRCNPPLGEDEIAALAVDIAERYEPAAPPQPSRDSGTATRGRVRLTVIGDVEMRRLEWIEDNLIARAMLTGLVAPGGTAKGLYGVHLAAKLALRHERTLFLCSEDALNYIVRPRFEASGCDGRLAHALDVETRTGPRNLRFPSDLPLLREALALVQPTLVIIDPIASYLNPGLDMAKNNEVREVLQPLIALAEETGIGMMPVYHSGKDPSKGALGSVAFEDACRFVVTAAKDDEDPDLRHVELTKSVAGRTGYGRKLRIVEVPLEIQGETVKVAKLVDEGRSNKSVRELLTSRKTPGPDPTQREQAKIVLSEILIAAAGESVNADETKQRVIEETGVSASTAFRAFTELKDAGLAGASPTRDEYGAIVDWRWFAKPGLLVGRGDG
jgi:hypothetical protein